VTITGVVPLAVVDLLLTGLCVLVVLSAQSTVLGAASSLVVAALIWEPVGAFYVLFLSDIRAGRSSFLAWFSVLSVTVLVLILAVATDPWVAVTLAVLTGRHLLARRSGQLQSAFADVVRFVFAIFPAAWLAYLLCVVLDLDWDSGTLLCGGLYFTIRLLYRTLWDPHHWLGIEWNSG